MIADHVSEATFQATVMKIAALYGWRVCHYRPARMPSGRYATPVQGDKGAPDLLLAKGGVVILAELKKAKGRTSPEQDEWLAQIGAHARIWRPGDIEDIKRELSRPVRAEGETA